MCGDRNRREKCVEELRPERTRRGQLRGDGGPPGLKKTNGHGHEHLCHTGMPMRNGNFGTDRTTATNAARLRKQLYMVRKWQE